MSSRALRKLQDNIDIPGEEERTAIEYNELETKELHFTLLDVSQG